MPSAITSGWAAKLIRRMAAADLAERDAGTITTPASSRSLIANATGSERSACGGKREPEVERAVGRLDREAEVLAERRRDRLAPPCGARSARLRATAGASSSSASAARCDVHRRARHRVRVHDARRLEPLAGRRRSIRGGARATPNPLLTELTTTPDVSRRRAATVRARRSRGRGRPRPRSGGRPAPRTPPAIARSVAADAPPPVGLDGMVDDDGLAPSAATRAPRRSAPRSGGTGSSASSAYGTGVPAAEPRRASDTPGTRDRARAPRRPGSTQPWRQRRTARPAIPRSRGPRRACAPWNARDRVAQLRDAGVRPVRRPGRSPRASARRAGSGMSHPGSPRPSGMLPGRRAVGDHADGGGADARSSARFAVLMRAPFSRSASSSAGRDAIRSSRARYLSTHLERCRVGPSRYSR